MARAALDRLTRRFGTTLAVADVSLDIADGELVALLGPSGCGKTTTLRMVAGFVAPSSGRIRIGERDVTDLPPYRRNSGMVFQGYALFPHMTVAENVAFGLEMRRFGRSDIRARVAEALRLVRLEALASRLPREISGGQQQRVALARALVISPDILLLDEPLSNLDAKLREEVRLEIRALQRRLGLTTLFVTHDQEEALTLADRLVLMKDGVIQQIGTPAELYERPANLFVAGFIGKSNFLRGAATGAGEFVTSGGLRLRCPAAAAAGPAVLAIRPERITVATAPAGDGGVGGRIERVTYLGGASEIELRCASGERLVANAINGGWAAGAEAWMSWAPEAALVLRDEVAS